MMITSRAARAPKVAYIASVWQKRRKRQASFWMWPGFAGDLSGQSGSDLGIFAIFCRRIEGGVARECWTQENNLHHWHNQSSFWQGTTLMHLLMQRCALDFFSLLRLHEPVMQRVQLIRKRHSLKPKWSAHLRFGNRPPAGRSGIRWVGINGERTYSGSGWWKPPPPAFQRSVQLTDPEISKQKIWKILMNDMLWGTGSCLHPGFQTPFPR